MKISVILTLDKASQDKINKLKQLLNKNRIDTSIIVPHVTIAAFEACNEDSFISAVANFAARQSAIPLTLASIGTFMTPKNVIFYAPVMTDALKDANRKIHKLILDKFYITDKHYMPGSFVPHCTIASKITDEQMAKAFVLLKTNNILPLDVVLDNLCVLQIDSHPYKQVFCTNLKN